MEVIKEHFPLTIYGSKTKELKKLEKFFPTDVKTVVEPFSGSFAVIRYFYCDEKYKKIINDTDKDLIDLYVKICEEPEEVIKVYDKMAENEHHANATDIRNQLNKLGYPKLFDTFDHRGRFEKRFITAKQPFIQPLSDFLNLDSVDMFNTDWREIMEIYKDDPEAFIFLDPPYFNSFNMAYYDYKQDKEKEIKDNSLMFVEMLEYLKTAKAKIMIILNEVAITDYILKDYKKHTYGKTYGGGNKTRHIIYTNF